jgi:hypothetical protein
MTEQQEQPATSGLLQNIFPDGTIEYDGEIGLPEDFPLTEAEANEIALQFAANPIEPPQE